MAFCIKMQPFLADRYYHYLKERFPEQAMDAFMTAFHRYATQRKIRAAQRAVRDGTPLDFENYQKYREVVSTLYDSSCCTHCCGPYPMDTDMPLGVRVDDAPPYPFIVANGYFTMKKVLAAIFGQEGTRIAEDVKRDFIQYYEAAVRPLHIIPG